MKTARSVCLLLDDAVIEAVSDYIRNHRERTGEKLSAARLHNEIAIQFLGLKGAVNEELRAAVEARLDTRRPGRPPDPESATAMERRERMARVEAGRAFREEQAKIEADNERYKRDTVYKWEEERELEGSIPKEWLNFEKLAKERGREKLAKERGRKE